MLTLLRDNTRNATRLLQELEAYLKHHPGTFLMSSSYEPFPGLLPFPENANRVYHNYVPHYETPWGLARAAQLPVGGYRELSYAGLHILEPEPGVEVPAPQVPTLATAVINPVTSLGTVYAAARTSAEAFTGAEPCIWQGQVDPGQSEHRQLQAVTTELARLGLPYYPATLFHEDVAYPWRRHHRLINPPTVSNHEVSLPLVGYVVDQKSQEIIYLSVVGHKTATRSIWGSLSTKHRRVLTVANLRATSTHTYATFTTVLDPDTGLQRLQLVDRRVFATEAAEGAYLVIPQAADVDLEAALAARLSAVLPIAVRPHWDLLKAGKDLALIRDCLVGGDVRLAYALTADPGWLELIHNQVTAGALTL